MAPSETLKRAARELGRAREGKHPQAVWPERRCGAWEVDLSFPSAHTQFFAGLFACASTLMGPCYPLGAAIGLSHMSK